MTMQTAIDDHRHINGSGLDYVQNVVPSHRHAANDFLFACSDIFAVRRIVQHYRHRPLLNNYRKLSAVSSLRA